MKAYPGPKLYGCARRRAASRAEHEVGRVIARPFEGAPGEFRPHRETVTITPSRRRARICWSRYRRPPRCRLHRQGRLIYDESESPRTSGEDNEQP